MLRHSLHLAPALLVLAACVAQAQPARPAPFPTHCKPGEHSVVNARMGRTSKTGQHEKNGKIMSLCASSTAEPFSSLAYRYGPLGKVEIERLATPKDRFKVFSRSTGPRMGEDIVHFSSGSFNYYVVIAQGMTRGVTIHVFQNGKPVAELFSGIEDSDYAEGPAAIQSLGGSPRDKAKSPILVIQEPTDSF